MADISAVMTFHREGLLAGPSIRSFQDALAAARQTGLTVEPIIMLDRTDDITRSMLSDALDWGAVVHETEFGDPGLTRNAGVSLATGKYVTFLDGDDLWGFNWLIKAYKFCEQSHNPLIAHSEFNIVFGGERSVWLHQDSEDPLVDLEYLQVGNYWDALSFAAREIYLRFPFRKNDLSRGYGHEDWHWNIVTIAEGLPHKPVSGTVHIKRRRRGSQSDRANSSDVVPWFEELLRGKCTQNACHSKS